MCLLQKVYMEIDSTFKKKLVLFCHKVELFFSSLYFRLRSLLVTPEGFKLSHFFSHGGFHIIVGIVVVWCALELYDYTKQNIQPVYKKVKIKTQCEPYSPMTTFYCDFFMGGLLHKRLGIYQGMEILISYDPIDSLCPVYGKDSVITGFRNYKYTYAPLRCPALPDATFSRRTTLEISSSTSRVDFLTFYDDEIPKRHKSVDGYIPDKYLKYVDSLGYNYIRYQMYYNEGCEIVNGIHGCFTGDLMATEENENNPYLCFYVEIDASFPSFREDVEDCGDCMKIEFYFGNEDTLSFVETPINIINIYPQPSKVSPGRLEYRGRTKFMEIWKNGGIYFLIENLNKKAISERKVYLYTILLGGALAFLLDIIVHLIIKWRNLSEKESNPSIRPSNKKRKGENMNNPNKTDQRYYEAIEE